MEGFERLRNRFRNIFHEGGDWQKYEDNFILLKTQAPEAEMRAAMLAEDKGWKVLELDTTSPLGGDIDEILKIEGKLWYGEVKSDIPGGDLNKWLTNKEMSKENSLYKLMNNYKKASNMAWEYKGIKRLKIYLPDRYAGYRSEILNRIKEYKGELGMKDWDIELVFFGGM